MRALTCVILTALAIAPADAQLLSEDRKLLASDATDSDLFGAAVAVTGELVAIGAPAAPGEDPAAGAVYLYDATTGAELGKLFAENFGQNPIMFGAAIDLAGPFIVVGAPQDDPAGSLSGAGFIYNASTRALLHEIVGATTDTGDRFGTAVATDGVCVVVGSPLAAAGAGSAFLFDPLTGDQLHQLMPDVAGPNFRFGASVAVQGPIAAVSASQEAVDDQTNAGVVYIFDTATGEQLNRITPDDLEASDRFGTSIDLDQDLLVVGSCCDDDDHDNAGSAYVFNASTGAQLHKLRPTDAAPDDRFGSRVAINSGVVIIGADRADPAGDFSGTAYLFNAATGAQIAKLTPSDADLFDFFGAAVAIDAERAVVGAPFSSDDGPESGSAYTFAVPDSCPADLAEPFGTLDFSDVLAFLGAFGAMDPAADLAAPFGTFDFSDVLAFLSAFGAGCP